MEPALTSDNYEMGCYSEYKDIDHVLRSTRCRDQSITARRRKLQDPLVSQIACREVGKDFTNDPKATLCGGSGSPKFWDIVATGVLCPRIV